MKPVKSQSTVYQTGSAGVMSLGSATEQRSRIINTIRNAGDPRDQTDPVTRHTMLSIRISAGNRG